MMINDSSETSEVTSACHKFEIELRSAQKIIELLQEEINTSIRTRQKRYCPTSRLSPMTANWSYRSPQESMETEAAGGCYRIKEQCRKDTCLMNFMERDLEKIKWRNE